MNPVQNAPYLRAQRNFPNDSTQALTVELDKAYVDIANRVNARVIGIYATGSSAVTGEQWFTAGGSSKQQSLRQVYAFTSTSSILHGINLTNGTMISPSSRGEYTDGTNWYGLIFGSNTAIAGQISFYVTPTQIVFASGAGAPSLTSGMIVLEWISQV